MRRSGAITLSDRISPALTLACKPRRRGRFNVACLQAKNGGATLPDPRRFLTADCPKHRAVEGVDRCQALSDPAPQTRCKRPTSKPRFNYAHCRAAKIVVCCARAPNDRGLQGAGRQP